MSAPRIALVHAMPVAIEPVAYVFRELWPQARVTHLLDDSLPADLTAAGSITPAIVERFIAMARYCESCGADAVLFTCSAFGTAIDAASRGIQLRLKTRTIPAAIAALQKGRAAEHDQLIAAAAAEIGPCDALVLGQFSMARAATGIPATAGRKVLTSPHSAVARLKSIFAAI